MRLIQLLCAAALLVLPLPALAQTPAAGKQADLDRIESYLNGLTTAEADFTMVAPDGAISKGRFDLSRPGKLRFDYSDPKGDFLVADGDYIIFWDAKQQEASNEPISETPASFLLKPRISLTDGVKVTRYEHAAGVIRITLVEDKDPGAGSVTIAFSDQPLELRGWRVTDAQGQVTDVTFSGWRLGLSLDPGLFRFKDPKAGVRHR
ncbi:MAG TPA: outer membrane lipoprotein carrier protein LolA [Alphaproteobacteria bacterium]|nr:outer membrane lipoprotein carrier protein LolA [Alphaproteobacteria bacterium]